MNTPGRIQYLTRANLDTDRWNSCVEQASNGLIYSYSFYLDRMAPGWEALVLDDYSAVMPLTGKKKYGIYYLYQPFLVSQTGITGNNLDESLIRKFLDHIPEKYRYWDICLNHGNVTAITQYKIYNRSNYVLNLSPSYEILLGNYKENIHRNIKKGEQAGNRMRKGFDAEKVIRLASEQMKGDARQYRGNINRFRELYYYLHGQRMAETYGIFSGQDKLMASCIFFFSHKRAYYILVGNAPDGKNTGASPALIDAFIQENAGQQIWLDFEGSDIPGLARYYSGFGALEEKYPAIKNNHLPFFLKWLKK